MHLTFDEKAELDALKAVGGRTVLVGSWRHDPMHRRLVSKGLIRFRNIKRGVRHGMVECSLTKHGAAIAARFKKDWSALWGERHPELGAE